MKLADLPSGWITAIADKRCRNAFARLFLTFSPRIKAYLVRQGLSFLLAEEVTQETFLAVWRRADQFDPSRASVEAWLFAVARNQRIDALRREQRHRRYSPDDASAPQLTPEQLVHTNDDALQVRAALAALPREQADLMRRSYYDDQSHGRIAGDLGLPLGTVKSRLRNATQRLRLTLPSIIKAV